MALEEQMNTYSMDEVVAAAPFEVAGRGIAGIEEMAQCVRPDRVYFGVLQIEIGHCTFARHKNVFIHFQGEDLKVQSLCLRRVHFLWFHHIESMALKAMRRAAAFLWPKSKSAAQF